MDTAGLNYEAVKVTTSEGYVLNMFHITSLKAGASKVEDQTKGPLLLVHGEDLDSTQWLDGSANDSIALRLY